MFPILLELDGLIGHRARAKHSDWKRRYQKKIDRLTIRARNLIDDLHPRVAYELVQSFDVILLPSFETKEMSSTEDRKIKIRTFRSMLGLAHYRFKLKRAWMCRKYGKRLVIGSEAYTRKTRSRDGVVDTNLGSAKAITDGEIRVDRDVNGAQGFLLPALDGDLGRSQAAA